MKLDNYINSVLRWRWLVVGGMVLVMLALAAGGQFVTVTNDYRILFRDDNPELLAFNALEDRFSASDRALIAVAPKDGSVFTRETLDAIESLTEDAWLAPYSSRVDSLTNYSHSESFEDDLIVEPLVEDALSLTDDDLARVEAIALDAIDIVGRLVSRDGRVGGLAITFILPENHDEGVVEITDYLNHLIAETRANYPNIDLYLTGDVVMNRAFADTTKQDIEKLAPLVFLIIVLFTAVLLRSIFGTVAIITMLMFVIASTVGLIGWAGKVLSPTNSGIPIIVMVVAVAQSVHIVTHTVSNMNQGFDKIAAIAQSIRNNAYPVFLTSITTAIGFLSLNASDSPPFQVLGNFVAFGVLCTFVNSMTLLPALLCILPLRARRVRSQQSAFFERFAEFVIARRKFLLWSGSVFAIVLIAGIPRNELSDNWTKYFDERFQFRRDTDFVIENLTGMESLEYSLSAGRDGGITDPEYLRAVDAFADWYRGQPEVTYVQAFSDTMKRLNKNMHGDDPNFYRIPDDPELAAQYLLIYELSLPFGSDLNDRIDIAKSATRMTVVIRNVPSKGQRELDQRAQDWLLANSPELATEASGVSIIFAHLSIQNITSMLRGTITAMALISLILVLVFKSVRIGLASLVPNFIPAAMSFGLWGYMVGTVGMAASVVTAIAFGIVVDDTIHFLNKYLKARREGQHASDAVRSAFRTVGRALFTTTAVLVAGFLVFATSGFQLSWALGILVSMTLAIALMADFLLLPPLLLAIDRRKTRQ